MTRRVLISTAVMEKPELVIADEPTPGLHISAARRVLSHFREIADRGLKRPIRRSGTGRRGCLLYTSSWVVKRERAQTYS